MGAILGAAAQIGGSLIGAKASKKASKQQADSALQSLDLQREIFESTSANQAPFIEGGQLAQEALLFELGLGDAPTVGGTSGFRAGGQTFDTRQEAEKFVSGFTQFEGSRAASTFELRPDEKEGGFKVVEVPGAFVGGGFRSPTGGTVRSRPSIEEFSSGGRLFEGFQESPGFKFAKAQGISAVDASAAAGGSLFSGSTLQALTEFGQGFASQGRGAFLDRLAGLVGSGQSAVGQLGQSAASFGQGAASALAGLGNAQSAGTIGVANAFAGGLNNLATQVGAFDFDSFFGGGSSKAGGDTFKLSF